MTTVQELIDKLKGAPDRSKPMMFGGSSSGLTFGRVKDVGDFVNLEFNEIIVPNERGEVVIHKPDHP